MVGKKEKQDKVESKVKPKEKPEPKKPVKKIYIKSEDLLSLSDEEFEALIEQLRENQNGER